MKSAHSNYSIHKFDWSLQLNFYSNAVYGVFKYDKIIILTYLLHLLQDSIYSVRATSEVKAKAMCLQDVISTQEKTGWHF